MARWRRKAQVQLLVFSSACLLAGCAGSLQPRPAEPGGVRAHERALRALQGWQVQGRLGAWNDETSLSAAMLWQDRADGFDVRLVAPLGLGTLNVRQRNRLASVRRGSRTLATGDDAGLLLQQVLGLQSALPLQPMRDWLRGLPGNGARQVRRDAFGRLESWRYEDASGADWRASIKRYGSYAGLAVPELITAAGGTGAGQWRVRIVLKQWQAAAPTTAPQRLSIPGQKDRAG